MKRIATDNPASILGQWMRDMANAHGLDVNERELERWAEYCAEDPKDQESSESK